MKNWIDENRNWIRMLLFLGNILIFIHFHVVHLQDAFVAIVILSVPLAFCYGFLTNLFIPSGSRRSFYSNRSNGGSGDYSE